MRRQLGHVVPVLLRLYHLKPWELDLLTSAELDALKSDLRNMG